MNPSFSPVRIRLSLMAAALTVACAAQAQTATPLRIDAQPLGSALNALALQSGARILFASKLTDRKEAAALSGTYTVEQALSVLLAGTGLTADRNGADIVIRQGSDTRAAPGVTALTPVLVTASRNERYLNDLPMSVSVVGPQQLAENPQTSVTDQLKQTPGVLVSGTNEVGSQKISIRGNSYTRTLVLIDGVRQSDFRGLGGAGNIGMTVNPADIERIEVIKGPSSVLYGSDAIGGVVNIITKSGKQADRPLQGSVDMLYNSANRAFEPTLAVQGAAQGFSYRFSGNGMNAQDLRTPELTLPYSEHRQRNYSGRLAYAWDNNRVELAADRHTGSFEATPATFEASNSTYYPTLPDSYNSATTLYHVPRNDRSTYRAKAQFSKLGKLLTDVNVSVYHQKLTTDSATDYVQSGLPLTQFRFEHTSYGGSVQSNWRLGENHAAQLGLDLDQTDYKGQDSFFTAGLRTGSFRSAGTERNAAIFFQDEWSVTDDTLVTMGLRHTRSNVKLEESERFPDRVSNDTTSKTVASLGAVYSGIDNTQLRALFSQGFRNPNMYIRYMGSTNANRHILPNPDLKPETSNNYELGARYNNGQLNADVSLFYSDIRDGIRMVTLSRSSSGVFFQNQNDDKTRSYGAEFAVSYAIADTGFEPYASLSLLRYKTVKRDFSTKHNGVPSAWGTLGLKWATTTANGAAWFVDAQTVMSRGAHSELVNDLTGQASGSEYRSGWGIANLTVGYNQKVAGLEYRATVALRNAFDRNYTPAPGGYLPEAGRHVVATVGVSF